MIYNIRFNEENHLFKECKIKQQYLNNSKDVIKALFKSNFEATNKLKAEHNKDYVITSLFGSTQLNYFKVNELK